MVAMARPKYSPLAETSVFVRGKAFHAGFAVRSASSSASEYNPYCATAFSLDLEDSADTASRPVGSGCEADAFFGQIEWGQRFYEDRYT